MLALTWLGASQVTALAQPVPTLKPPAPISPYVSPSQAALLHAHFDALEKRQYELADTIRSQITESIPRSVADWAYWRNSSVDVSSYDIAKFLDTHYGWPESSGLQSKVERAFTDETSAAEILDFFQKRDPITGEGHLHLARAFLEKGNRDAARGQLRIAWVDFDWSAPQEQNILSRYGRYLSADDHWAKADRQFFEIKASATDRLIPYLSASRQAEARVRSAFLKMDKNGELLYQQLSSSSKLDSGVLHAMTRFYRRTEQEDQAMLYASLAPIDKAALRDANAWFTERSRLARWALKTGRFNDAYTVSAYSGLDDGADFAEAEFMAGWVALRFLNDPERAKAHFAFLSSGVTSPISLARGEYWLGRAWEAAGDRATAAQHYRVAAAYPFTFYGQMAIEAIGPTAPRMPFPEETHASDADRAVFEARPLVHAMRILAEVGEDLHFDRFARALDDQIESEGEVAAYFDLVIEERKPYLAVRGGKVARNNGSDVPAVVYPVIPVPQDAKRFAEEPLILGLSRQESEFNPRAYSRARARGLMQLLDSTARLTARKEGLPYSTSRLMDDPAYNLVIGAAHLNHLMERFDGSYIMVLAAYNAGPHRVDTWIEEYGDPRDPSVDPIDWIELIPFSETRNYVMRVLENTQVYRARLTGDLIGGRLGSDITRGGNSLKSIGVSPAIPRLVQVSLDEVGGPDIWINKPAKLPPAVEAYDALKFPPIAPGLSEPRSAN